MIWCSDFSTSSCFWNHLLNYQEVSDKMQTHGSTNTKILNQFYMEFYNVHSGSMPLFSSQWSTTHNLRTNDILEKGRASEAGKTVSKSQLCQLPALSHTMDFLTF